MNIKNIRRICSGVILKNEPMSGHTTFRTGGPADYYIIPRNDKELAALVRYFGLNRMDYYVIGNGSNLLVSDKGYRGIVIDIGKNDGTAFTMLGYDHMDDELIMDAGAGCLMSAVGKFAAKFGGTGFEELSGIPGCIGGACVMNAGAFGREMKDVVRKVEAVDRKGQKTTLHAEDISFRYRGSSLKDSKLIVTRVEIALKHAPSEDIEKGIEEYTRRRQEKQPLEYPSAGSVFKRPEGSFAGKLIEESGLKGFGVGGAQVSEKHAGFIINKGGASSADIFSLIRHVQGTVLEKTGIQLETEVQFLGDFD